MVRIGLDVGSTTLKAIVLDERDGVIYSDYRRHFSKIAQEIANVLSEIKKALGIEYARICMSGSAGMGIAESAEIQFVQEVYATRVAVDKLIPGADVVVELGGEDAKIIFLTRENGGPDLEARMNGSCAGGTGAFIDQMSALLGISPDDMNDHAYQSEKTYAIASRCGVFAKSDIQPLLNQGARVSDISASIFKAVVNQTIGGLAQGRPISGRVVYLGGPLTFMPALRKSFNESLAIEGVCPENSLYFVAIGAALRAAGTELSLDEYVKRVQNRSAGEGYISCRPLFENMEEYRAFKRRHAQANVKTAENADYAGDVYIGMDAGSTTFKAVALDENENILFYRYQANSGNPVGLARLFLEDFYAIHPYARVRGSCATGYGEALIKNAFSVDFGLIETMAHFTAAQKFLPGVDFIIDIGGQDIKCFKVRGGAIDNIFLNEACSSGCGSFLQTFAGAWDMTAEQFAEKGLFAERPVDLGSRCTVFMNSSVKQAQKDGALIEDISAGLSMSVVKNALYKVIRAANADQLGERIVVQGGTFLSDAVLRAFEQEIGREVVRPNIAGLMGAYGAALYAKRNEPVRSTLLGIRELKAFKHNISLTECGGCENRCKLTINIFDNGRRFIGGNRCERAVSPNNSLNEHNLYEFKRHLLGKYRLKAGFKGTIGLPMALNMLELLPFWYTVFDTLGFTVAISPKSSQELYLQGHKTIPSDTVCYPAKLVHGHIEALLDMNVDAIFYPCLSYNIDEGRGDNHYNCPVVAYYPEVIEANASRIKQTDFIYEYMTINNEKLFANQLQSALKTRFGVIPKREIKRAFRAGHAEYAEYMKRIRNRADELFEIAKRQELPVVVLAGRPYHLDEEVNHGIDRLICELGAVLISEDGAARDVVTTSVIDQWTYHARLYSAAQRCVELGERVNFVQLVSFGCGLDAVTTDEARSILEDAGRIYTQIKIDEITNLGAVRIRLRSLFSALETREVQSSGTKA